jgi:ABC-type transport system involved in multi-copper enzyme maturation permease subunit
MSIAGALDISFRLRQIWVIAQLQLRRVFFSRRSFWVYGLALFPSVIFFGHGIETKLRQSRWASRATPVAALESIREGDRDEDVLRRAGEPIEDFTFRFGPEETSPVGRHMRFYDGNRKWELSFESGILQRIRSDTLIDLEEDRQIYAAVFHQFYLRLSIFFGCLGIFMNLFRGEMLDKTLHFWFLIPARREVLLAGKYLAGLIAAVLIFTTGAALSFGLMLWPQDSSVVAAFWREHGASHLFWYLASAMLGCVGYGSVFLAAGLLLRNPIIPAVVILFWESINRILPGALQKLSVLYYAQSLCPVPPPVDAGAPLLVQLLASPAEPPSAAVAVFGLIGLTALVLWAASRAVRRLEINYSAE